jgi:Uma2 family endonuclease
MPASTARKIKFATFADVQERIGHVPDSRILSFPAPGTATVQDLLDNSITKDRGCELVDGILVEKPLGFRSEYIAFWIGHFIASYLQNDNLGTVTGSQGPIRFKLNLVRIPDVSFIRWDSVEDTDEIENPPGAFLETAPDLAVEVLSPGNTPREMEIKLAEYAKAGVKLVWYVDPERKEVDVYPKGNPKQKKTLAVDGTLDGGEVLPGFSLPVAKIFESRAPAKKPGRKGKK